MVRSRWLECIFIRFEDKAWVEFIDPRRKLDMFIVKYFIV